MVGENHLSEMQACYAGTQPLFNYVSAALQDIEHLHLVKALKNLEAFVYHFQMDVAPCTHMGDDVAAIEQWAAQFKSPTSLISNATKHYLFHKKQITTDIDTIKSDWSTSKFFDTGKQVADLVTVLVGPIE